MSAGLRYLVIQVSSGLLLLAGAILLSAETGSLAFNHIGLDSAGGWLDLRRLRDQGRLSLPPRTGCRTPTPNATVTGTVFLSAFTTKLAIYALARGFAGTEILIPIGVQR